jgi:hypothetical protein
MTLMGVQVPEAGLVEDFVRFFESLKRLGIEVIADENWRTVKVKGELKYMNFNDIGYNIEIGTKNIIIGCSESRDAMTISVWKVEDGRQILIKRIWLKGSFFTLYDSPYLRIKYVEINEMSELVEMPERINEMINKVKEAGFEVEHYPKKREIRIKGEIERVITFGHPRPLIRLRKGESLLAYEKDVREHHIVVIKGDETTHYKIGEGEEVSVRVEYPYLIIRYSVV